MVKPNISVLGIGYVGLCTAVGFASEGYNVIASTHDAEKAAKINKGIPPFHEPNLQNLLQKTIKNGRLKCLINQTEKAVLETDLTFNAVGTPSRPDGSIDLPFIETSSRDLFPRRLTSRHFSEPATHYGRLQPLRRCQVRPGR